MNNCALCIISQGEIEFYEATIALVADVDEEEVPGGVPFSPRQVFIELEDQVVMTHHSWTDALVCLFGLIYALHLSYPKKYTGFFEFIQVVLLKLDDERKQLKPKLQTLKNELVQMMFVFHWSLYSCFFSYL